MDKERWKLFYYGLVRDVDRGNEVSETIEKCLREINM